MIKKYNYHNEKINKLLEYKDSYTKPLTTEQKNVIGVILENELNHLNETSSWSSNSMGGQPDGSNFSSDGIFTGLVFPVIRRTVPQTIAMQVCGVQPLTGPQGAAYFLKATANGVYDGNSAGTELLYKNIDSNYANTVSVSAGEQLGTDTGDAVKQVNLEVYKSLVEAKTKKLKAKYSQELAQDLESMHGIEIQNELIEIIADELILETDREILNLMKSKSVSGGMDYDTLTGRWEQEKNTEIYNRIVRDTVRIAKQTRRGAGNFVIASADVSARLSTLANFAVNPINNQSETTGVGFTGALAGGKYALYTDYYATDDTILIGYHGKRSMDNGVMYLPYVPLMLSKAVDSNSFQPSIGLMTRFALAENTSGISNGKNMYYRKLKINNLPN